MKFDISSDNVYFTSDTSFVLVSIATTRTGKDILTQETQTDTFASLLASAASLLVSLCVHLRRVLHHTACLKTSLVTTTVAVLS